MTKSLPLIVVCYLVLCYSYFCHGFLHLLDFTSVYILRFFLALRRMMTADWYAPGCALCFSYSWKIGERLPLEKHVYVVRKHERSTAQLFPVFSATACGLFMNVDAACQKLRVICGDSRLNVSLSSRQPFPLVARNDGFGSNEVCNEELDNGDWDSNDVEDVAVVLSTVCARAVRARFTNVQDTQSTTGLHMPGTVLDHLFGSTEAPITVATSFFLMHSLNASVLLSRNELLCVNVSKSQSILQAR